MGQINIEKIDSTIISWLLSSLSYDEHNFKDYVELLLPGFKCHRFLNDHGDHFYGVVTDDKNGRAWQFNRGTDAFDPFGHIKAWIINLRVNDRNGDGIFDGIEEYGEETFDATKDILEDYDIIHVTGHSQGANKSQYVAVLCVENLTVKHVHFDQFAAFPTGTQIFADRVNSHIKKGKLSGIRYSTFGEPLSNYELRSRVNGIFAGEEIVFQPIIRYSLGPVNVLNHSCTIYNAALMIHYALMKDHHYEVYEMFGEIARRIVN